MPRGIYERTPEMLERKRQSTIKYWANPENRRKQSEIRKKQTHTDEWKEQKSKQMKEYWASEEGQDRKLTQITNIPSDFVYPKGEEHWNYGNKHSDYTKDKMSQAKKGRNHPKYKGDIVTPTGIYPSYVEAGKDMDILPQNVWTRVKSKNPKFDDYYFIPVDEDIVL